MIQTPVYILDDVQRLHKLELHQFEVLENKSIHILSPRAIQGQKYAPEFVYKSKKDAEAKSHDWHRRLNQAFEKVDMLTVMSVSKEFERISQGFSQKDLDKEALHDREQYKAWKMKIQTTWKEITGEDPDFEKIGRELIKAQFIKELLENPLAKDFTTVLVTESKKRVKHLIRSPKQPPSGIE